MLTSIRDALKRFTVTLRFSLLSIFLTLFIGTISLLIILTYLRAKSSMLYTADKLMLEISNEIISRINEDVGDAAQELNQAAKLIKTNSLDVKDIPQLSAYISTLANRYTAVKSAFWADDAGNLLIAETEIDLYVAVRMHNAKDPLTEYVRRYDPQGNLLSSSIKTLRINLDPRQRSWYQLAKKEKRDVWTNIYTLEYSTGSGITWAMPVFDKANKFIGVVGLDISADNLSYFVERQKIGVHGIVYIVDRNGKLIAFPYLKDLQKENIFNVASLNNDWLKKSFNIYNKNQQTKFIFNFQGNKYLARYEPIPYFKNQHWLVGVVVPQDDFVGDLKRTTLLDLFVGLIILIIGTYIVSKVITLVIKPIKELVKQTEKIKNFQLDDEKPVFSRIKEVTLLANAIYAMKLGLKSFQKYIPEKLVRQLIQTGEALRIGGVKKNLTILFSDVKNFTNLAENMHPDLLMQYMCDYFEEVSKIIVAEKGTIDKYIGDSVMAFWGAPIEVQNPNIHAAYAALKCKKRISELNIVWKNQNKEPLYTRIGVHAGEAVVGNVGSSERMNYTALGDAINMASRLEGVNKIYGTQITVSEPVYQDIKDQFILRKMDEIAVKGKKISVIIYELLAKEKSELTFDIVAYNLEFTKGYDLYKEKQWNKAIIIFQKCLQIYPEDTVANVFIKRCQYFIDKPPEVWDGVWRVEG